MLVGAVWMGVRTARMRTELTAAGVVNHGAFATRAYPVAAITEFLAVPAGAGGQTLMILRGQGSRPMAAGAGFGDYPARTADTLNDWLAAR